MQSRLQLAEHGRTRVARAACLSSLLFNVTAFGQVQIDFDLTAGEGMLGYENFGGETMDLVAVGVCEECEQGSLPRTYLAVTATDRGTGCPSPDPLRIYARFPDTSGPYVVEATLDPLQGARPLAVAMDEDLLVVGLGPHRSNQDGYALVYRRDTNGVWNQEATLYATDPEPWDEFGASVAIRADPGRALSNSVIVVGAPNEGSGAGTTSFQRGIGAAYVFQNLGTNWIETAKLIPSEGDIGDRFGDAVSIDESPTFVFVGAPDHSTAGLNTAGAVYVFDTAGTFETKWFEDPDPDPVNSGGEFGRSVACVDGLALVGDMGKVHLYWYDAAINMQWEFRQTIIPTGTVAYGKSIALTEDFAAVGDPLADSDEPGSGTVFVYERFGSVQPSWLFCRTETNAPAVAGDRYGSGIGMASNTLFASAPQHDATGPDAGAIFLSTICPVIPSGGIGTLAEGAPFEDENFGTSVAIDGNVMIVGIPGDEGCGDTGAAYIYRWSGGAWRGEARLSVPVLSGLGHFGAVVDIAGDVVVVGAPNDYLGEFGYGSAYVFTYNGQDWVWDGWLFGPAGGRFGHAVAVHEDTVLVGSLNTTGSFGPGRVNVFVRGESNWDFDRTVSAPDESNLDAFGASIDLNSQFAFIGAPGDDNDQGSVYVFDTTTWLLQGPKLRATDLLANDFGLSLAVSEDMLLIGAPAHNLAEGHVESFAREGGQWVYRQTFTTSANGLLFGQALDMDGGVAIVGGGGDGSGRVDVFFHDGTEWTQVETLVPSVSQPDSDWGRDVAVSGVHLAVGAPEHDEVRQNAGAVFPYTFDVTFTVPECPEVVLVDEVQRVTAPTPETGNRMGESVAVSRDFAAVGIPFKSFPGELPGGTPTVFGNVGRILIYERTGVREWTLHSWFNPSPNPTTANAQFGSSIAMDEDLMVVGAAGAAGTSVNDGSAFVFLRDGNLWSSEALLIGDDSEGWLQFFGQSVDIDGERIVVGAPNSQGPAALTGAGAAWVFERDTTGAFPIWNRSPTIWPGDVAFADHVGAAVAISGDWLLLGVPDDDPDGSAYLFQKVGTNWLEHPTKIKAPDTIPGDLFGSSVDIDGDVFVVGATLANTVSATRSGAGYVWRYNPLTFDWDFEQKLEPASAMQSEGIGRSVAMDHHTIAIGSLVAQNGITGANSGGAFVFQYDTNSLAWIERPPLYPSDGEHNDYFASSVAIAGGNVWIGAVFTDDDTNIPPSLDFNSGSAYTFDLICSPGGPPDPAIVMLEILANPNPLERMVRIEFEERGGIASSYELWRATLVPTGWMWSVDGLYSTGYVGGLTFEATTDTGSLTQHLFRIEASP